jgi:GntR family transcriptional regulator
MRGQRAEITLLLTWCIIVVVHSSRMPPLLRIDPRDARPIWRQIEEGVQHLVARGALPAGALVPSVRDLARDLQVNPATVSKAYQRLTDAGVLAVRRGEGTFVSETPPPVEDARRNVRLHEEAVRYASLAITLGASREETLTTLETAWLGLTDGKSEGDAV